MKGYSHPYFKHPVNQIPEKKNGRDLTDMKETL